MKKNPYKCFCLLILLAGLFVMADVMNNNTHQKNTITIKEVPTMELFSELKAAAAKYSVALNAHRENPTDKGALYAWDTADGEFSALINNNEMEIIIALLAKLEAKSQCIFGLERHVKDIEATLIAATDEVADLTKERDEARAKLIMPVRLPLPYSPDPWMSPDPDGTWLDKEDVKKSIRAAGFVVDLCSACHERYCGNCAHANGAKVQ
ncbi:hypothetical protein I5Q39_24375 [Serratia marcescens]|nr:hypothetical protein [Serratia marcescens]